MKHLLKPIKIIKNRSDIGAGTRGSDLGIDALEIAAITKNSDYFIRHPFIDVVTHNESIYNKVNTPSAKRISFVKEQCSRLAKSVQHTLEKQYFPIVLSGDHSSALGTLNGIKNHIKNKQLGVVWIDAHADLHTPWTSPSGNVHGMPLAVALGIDNKKNATNSISKQTEKEWSEIKNITPENKIITPPHLIYFGVRDTEPAESNLMSTLNIKNYTVDELRYKGLKNSILNAVNKLKKCDYVYISFDVDSMDSDMVSDGTGTPVPKGFDPNEIFEIIKGFATETNVIGLEISEVNPLLDTGGNKMAEVTFEILNKITPLLGFSKKDA